MAGSRSLKRHVKKGEHGLKILAPIPFIKKEELEKLDPVTKQPIIGEDGQPVMEEYISVKSARFKPVLIYDIRQTDGEPLPNLAETLSGNMQRYELAHLKLRERQIVEEKNEKPIDYRSEEVIAESVAFSTLANYGVDTDANSFGYIASWSKTQELKELNACLDIIRKTTAELIDGIESDYGASQLSYGWIP